MFLCSISDKNKWQARRNKKNFVGLAGKLSTKVDQFGQLTKKIVQFKLFKVPRNT